MSAFTDFIQLELPKRPYLESDVPQNSVIVRGGAGPRQLQGVELKDGEILMNMGGTVQAVVLEDVTGGADGYVHQQTQASATWTVVHSGATENFLIQVFDDLGEQVFPDRIVRKDANTVEVRFPSPQTGKATVIFFTAE